MLCSVLIPTRNRPQKLARAVASILASCARPNVEILLWCDHDDPAWPETESLALRNSNVYAFRGREGDRPGYNNLHVYYDLLACRANGRWIWVFNDDAVIRGANWDQQLEGIPAHGVIVHPERHQLGASEYATREASPFPLVPLNCWHKFGNVCIPGMVDTAFDQMLRVGENWRVELLRGITVVHNREIDETLPKERF